MKRLTLALALIASPALAQTAPPAPTNLGSLQAPCRQTLQAIMKRTPDKTYLQRWVVEAGLSEGEKIDAYHQCSAYLRGINDQREGYGLPPYDND